MSDKIPETHIDLITGPVYATLTTINNNGEPENSVVWASWDGDHVLVNTARGRRKSDNVEDNRNVALIAIDPEDPFRWVDVRGVVDKIVPDENYSNINAHAKLYAGADQYYGEVAPEEQKGTEERIIFKIKPEHVVTYGN